jgi:hypothetical protein
MAAYDHWLWRLFFWWCGYRWHWVELPDDAVADLPVGGYLRWCEDTWKVVWRGDPWVFVLYRAASWGLWGDGRRSQTARCDLLELSNAVPLKRCLAHKDWYAAIKAQPVGRD